LPFGAIDSSLRFAANIQEQHHTMTVSRMRET
jgi:hypothetical protein